MATDDLIHLPPRCGDCVRHRQSGEELLVAWADGDYFSWVGWPPGIGVLADYDIHYRCSDEEHRLSVDKWRRAESSGDPGGHRARVLRLYGDQLDDSGHRRCSDCWQIYAHYCKEQGRCRRLGYPLSDYQQRGAEIRKIIGQE